MPKLYVLSGPDTGRRFDVGDGAAIGRAAECAVQLHDVSVSRQHARLERIGTGWRIVDAGSRNGIRVHGERVPEAALRDGDEFQIGEVLVRFRIDGAAAASDPSAPMPAPSALSRAAELDEITLEEDPLGSFPPSAPSAVAETRTFAQPPERPPERAEPARAAPARPGAPVQRGQGVLQYQKVKDREGFFASDLAQQPSWVRVAVALLALAVFAAIFVVAFKGTSFLKSRAAGDAGESAAEESR